MEKKMFVYPENGKLDENWLIQWIYNGRFKSSTNFYCKNKKKFKG